MAMDEEEPRRSRGGGEIDGERRRVGEEEEQNWPGHGPVLAHLDQARRSGEQGFKRVGSGE
jgi:hypothetical protein